MFKSIHVSGLSVILVLFLSCADPAPTASLMDSMPAGHDIYVTLDPELAGFEQILDKVRGYVGEDDEEFTRAVDIIGFDPLDWNEWTEALAMRPGEEIGLVLDGGRGDFETVTFYIPTDDASALEEFVRGVRNRAEEAEADVRFISSGGYTAVSFFEEGSDPGPEGDYALDSSLGDLEDYSRLTGVRPEGETVLRMFAYAGRFPDTDGLRWAMLEAAESGNRVALAMGFSTEEDVPYLSVISPDGPSGDVTLPEGVNAAARISLDMPYLKGLLAGYGIDRELSMGLTEFGFSSFGELLDSFRGDVYAGIMLSGNGYGGFLQLGIRDMEAVDRMLGLIFQAAAGSDDPGMSTFEFGGRNCYRTTSTESIDLDFLEFGVIGSALVIAGNVSLEEIAQGTSFSDYASGNALGLDTESGFMLTADLESICESDLVDVGFRRGVESSGIRRCAVTCDYEAGVFALSAGVEFTDGGGFGNLVRFLSGI